MATARVDGLRDLRRVQVAVLAKAPIPGLAKTRLIPALGAPGAARLQRQFMRAAVHKACAAGLGAVTLWCTPDARHRSFRALQRATGIACRAQPEGDLGQRMHAAFDCARAPLVLIGTDCPALLALHLRLAASALLDGDDVVVCPAEDGGYVLIGLREPQAALFDGMRWSSAEVMAQTRARARSLHLRLRELETLWDVDLPEDLARLGSLRSHRLRST